MNQPESTPGLRERLPLAPQREEYFRWRGNEISRVEGFTDAVFAFAVTLLVVALEVPRTFEGLLDVVRAFPAFIICFTLLMIFWNAHFRYHRRYGLDDVFTRVMTMAILVLVLFFVYPLKFLFTLLTVQWFDLNLAEAPVVSGTWQWRMLFVIYGLGFAGVWSLYGLLYLHALRRREVLALTEAEVIQTHSDLAQNVVYVSVCLMSVLLALTLPAGGINDSLPGLLYFLLGPLQTACGFWYGRKVRAHVKALAAATAG
jgi:uncharacterized membrane protein